MIQVAPDLHTEFWMWYMSQRHETYLKDRLPHSLNPVWRVYTNWQAQNKFTSSVFFVLLCFFSANSCDQGRKNMWRKNVVIYTWTLTALLPEQLKTCTGHHLDLFFCPSPSRQGQGEQSEESKWLVKDGVSHHMCWQEFKEQLSWGARGPWFVVFGGFCGVNTPTVANFQLPVWSHRTGSWEGMPAVSSRAGAAPDLPRRQGSPVGLGPQRLLLAQLLAVLLSIWSLCSQMFLKPLFSSPHSSIHTVWALPG